MKINTLRLVLCALFTAITAVFAQIIIPVGVIPISLATFSVMIYGGILGTKHGIIITVLYILMGAVGIPVFSGFKGGISILFGPTGGFIFGYLLIAGLSGFAFIKQRKPIITISILCVSNVFCYITGILWYMLITKAGFVSAISVCVLPFLVGDAIKIAIGHPIIVRIKKQI